MPGYTLLFVIALALLGGRYYCRPSTSMTSTYSGYCNLMTQCDTLIQRYFLLVVLVAFPVFVMAQDHDHDHGAHHGHAHHRNELGMANALLHFPGEDELAYGMHFHLLRCIGTSRFGAGLCCERIFDVLKHNTFGVVGSYRPIDPLPFNLSPGLHLPG